MLLSFSKGSLDPDPAVLMPQILVSSPYLKVLSNTVNGSDTLCLPNASMPVLVLPVVL
jgi:hypothetical protein